MSPQWDLTAYNQENELVLAVEVKSKPEATAEWAAQLRRNILAHGTYANAPYFLIVSPTQLYLWKDSPFSLDPIQPTYIIDARPIFEPYLERAGLIGSPISGESLELIIASWLMELAHKTAQELTESEPWIVESGLHDILVQSTFSHAVMA